MLKTEYSVDRKPTLNSPTRRSGPVQGSAGIENMYNPMPSSIQYATAPRSYGNYETTALDGSPHLGSNMAFIAQQAAQGYSENVNVDMLHPQFTHLTVNEQETGGLKVPYNTPHRTLSALPNGYLGPLSVPNTPVHGQQIPGQVALVDIVNNKFIGYAAAPNVLTQPKHLNYGPVSAQYYPPQTTQFLAPYGTAGHYGYQPVLQQVYQAPHVQEYAYESSQGGATPPSMLGGENRRTSAGSWATGDRTSSISPRTPNSAGQTNSFLTVVGTPSYLGTPTPTANLEKGLTKPQTSSDDERFTVKKLEEILLQDPIIPGPLQTQGLAPISLEESLHNPLDHSNVYIRGVGIHTTDDMIHAWAQRFGNVHSSKAIVDTTTKLCKGYAFARFYTIDEAEHCIRALHHHGYEVSFAKESFNARLKTLGDQESTNLYLSGLRLDIDEENIQELFVDYIVLSSRILRDDNGNSRGVGFARFANRDVCEEIIKNYNGQPLGEKGQILQVRYSDTPDQKALKQDAATKRLHRASEYNPASIASPTRLVPWNTVSPLVSPVQYVTSRGFQTAPSTRSRISLRSLPVRAPNFDRFTPERATDAEEKSQSPIGTKTEYAGASRFIRNGLVPSSDVQDRPSLLDRRAWRRRLERPFLHGNSWLDDPFTERAYYRATGTGDIKASGDNLEHGIRLQATPLSEAAHSDSSDHSFET